MYDKYLFLIPDGDLLDEFYELTKIVEVDTVRLDSRAEKRRDKAIARIEYIIDNY